MTYLDGAPMGPHSQPHPWATPPQAAGKNTRTASRLRRNEGPRGYATRLTVALRHVAYLLTILLCSTLTEGLLAANAVVVGGGKLMLFVAALMLGTAAIGTAFYPTHRNEILDQAKHYVFGVAVVPGTALAAIIWVLDGSLSTGPTQGGIFHIAATQALPIVFLCTLVIPAAIFIKVVTGFRHLHQSRLDDEEMIALVARQDGLQR